MNAPQPPESPGAGDSHALRKKYRRRTPRFLVGLRRLALVLAVLVWGYSLYTAGGVSQAGFLEQHRTALAVTFVLAVGYWVIAMVANNSRGAWKSLARTAKASLVGGGRSKWERTTRLVSWIAVIVSIWFVNDVINEYESYSRKEVLVVMAIAAVGSFIAVRLISWVLRGFVKVK